MLAGENAIDRGREHALRDYVFDNDSPRIAEQHRCQAEVLDPLTVGRLAGIGVGGAWRCLDIGTGGGSVARWLAARVGPAGEVIATDVAPRPVPGPSVLRHDIVRDPLPGNGFHLIHARLVLQHLPARDRLVPKLVAALRPGGYLAIDEFDTGYSPALVGDQRARGAYQAFVTAKERVFRAAGGDSTWGRRVAQRMGEAGLVGIDPAVWVEVWRGGSPGARLQRSHTHLAERAFRRVGLTDRQLAEIREVLSDPEFHFMSPVRYWVVGRRAG